MTTQVRTLKFRGQVGPGGLQRVREVLDQLAEIYNTCLSQYRMAERQDPDLFNRFLQGRQLTQFRAEMPEFSTVLRRAQETTVKQAHTSWMRYRRDPKAGRPRFKPTRFRTIGVDSPRIRGTARILPEGQTQTLGPPRSEIRTEAGLPAPGNDAGGQAGGPGPEGPDRAGRPSDHQHDGISPGQHGTTREERASEVMAQPENSPGGLGRNTHDAGIQGRERRHSDREDQRRRHEHHLWGLRTPGQEVQAEPVRVPLHELRTPG